jgi:hypothetical protein
MLGEINALKFAVHALLATHPNPDQLRALLASFVAVTSEIEFPEGAKEAFENLMRDFGSTLSKVSSDESSAE